MESQKNNKIEDILNSLDGTQRAGVPDFFYTRLRARMERGLEKTKQPARVLRPIYVVTGLLLVLAVNAIVFLKNNNDTSVVADNDISQQSIAAEYRINDVTYVYDINQDR